MTKIRTPFDKRGPLAAALAPLRTQFPRSVVEREVLRVVATIPASDDHDNFAIARNEVLAWAKNRAAGTLPSAAWDGEPFETLAAGRTTIAARVEQGKSLLWSLRGDDPDKQAAGRIWSTEVSLGRAQDNEDIRLGVRLLVNSAEEQLVIEPAAPGLVRQIADSCGLVDGPVPMRSEAHHVDTEQHVDELIRWLNSEGRRLPVIVATGDDRSSDHVRPLIDVDRLGKALCGLGHVVAVPAGLTYRLTDMLDKELTVFHGGIRVYQPGFNFSSDPRDHRLILGHIARDNPQEIAAELRRSIARQSLRRTKLGYDVLSFAAVRAASIQARTEVQNEAGADESEKLATAADQIAALKEQTIELQSQFDQAFQLSADESERAEMAEKQLFSSAARIEMLENALAAAGKESVEAPVPSNWEEFPEWCDTTFAGQLSLTSVARAGIRKAKFEDIGLAVECIRWLAREARQRFMEGGGVLANISVRDGITNAPCGADEYTFDFQGKRLSANWHIKTGGNTRAPERCLRIYYTFDDQSRQIVVSDMPAHRRTGAS